MIDDYALIYYNLLTESPFGKAPWLEVDGKVIANSTAIARFIARRTGEIILFIFIL